MKIKYGKMLKSIKKNDVLVVTTNAAVNKAGKAVMGKGIAKEISDEVPKLPKLLAKKIKKDGHKVHYLGKHKVGKTKVHIIAFPVKKKSIKDTKANRKLMCKGKDMFIHDKVIPSFVLKADLNTIAKSMKQLYAVLSDLKKFNRVIMPRPGCGAGELKWADVHPLFVGSKVAKELDDRLEIYTFPIKNRKKVKIGKKFKSKEIMKAIAHDCVISTKNPEAIKMITKMGYAELSNKKCKKKKGKKK